MAIFKINQRTSIQFKTAIQFIYPIRHGFDNTYIEKQTEYIFNFIQSNMSVSLT